MRLQLLGDCDVPGDTIRERLVQDGYCLLGGLDESEFKDQLVRLGQIIGVTDVMVRPNSRALVTSRKALSPHTDHHRADLVAWYCLAQCEDGGETLLVDGRTVYDALAPEDRRALEGVLLKEHKVFPDDPESHPLAERVDEQVQLYYSYWLLGEELDPVHAGALARFRRALSRTREIRRRLEPGEALIVANRRILHGRNEIRGSRPRLLRRYWIATRRNSGVSFNQGGSS